MVTLACLQDFVSIKGYDYLVKADKSNISGGEAQRLNIAKALYRKKPFLIIDEGLSGLNHDIEMTIIENLKKMHLDKKDNINITQHKN